MVAIAVAMTPDYWPQAVAHLSAADPVLQRIIGDYPAEQLESRDDPFGTLARSIVGQQISVTAASAVWGRLETLVGSVTQQTIDATGPDQLLGCGLSRRKVEYLMELAGRFLDGSADPGRWRDLDDDGVIVALTTIKGIGRWTADMFLMFTLMRPDVLPVGDVGLQRAMSLHYRGQGKVVAAEMDEIADPWRPWRSVATWYLWRSLDPLPVEY
jgi:DNA-3-methyladenine glycosylase II